jgi:hypothetical protein
VLPRRVKPEMAIALIKVAQSGIDQAVRRPTQDAQPPSATSSVPPVNVVWNSNAKASP